MKLICPACGAERDDVEPGAGGRLVANCACCGRLLVNMDGTTIIGEAPGYLTDQELDLSIPGFRIEQKIAQGAMGVVYKATQESLNRAVALKVLPEYLADRPIFVERFYEETKALSTLSHPNIVTIIDRGNVGKTFYFAMEYIDGQPLSDALDEGFDTRRLLEVAESICKALRYAHAHEIVHRDIKPANIMLTRDGQVKVADFGLAGIMPRKENGARPMSASATRMGTPGYMSPEQMKDAMFADARSDIFSTGVVLYELATGSRPKVSALTLPSQMSERVDPRLDPIVEKCLRISPEERYQSAEAMLADIRRLRMELEAAPACPSCGHIGPVRFEKCTVCGQDLSRFFDVCVDCGHMNRRDVRRCLSCGADLGARRTAVLQRVERTFSEVDDLRLDERYDDALKAVRTILGLKGRALEASRTRARTLLENLKRERREAALRTFREGKLLFDAGDLASAIVRWESISPENERVRMYLELARTRAARFAAMRRYDRKMNALLIVAALVITASLVLFSWLT